MNIEEECADGLSLLIKDGKIFIDLAEFIEKMNNIVEILSVPGENLNAISVGYLAGIEDVTLGMKDLLQVLNFRYLITDISSIDNEL